MVLSDTHILEIHPLTDRLREKALDWWADKHGMPQDQIEETHGYIACAYSTNINGISLNYVTETYG